MPETEVTREQLLVSVRTLQPGDLLVVRVLRDASAYVLDDLAERLKAQAPEGIRILVLPKDLDVDAYRLGEVASVDGGA